MAASATQIQNHLNSANREIPYHKLIKTEYERYFLFTADMYECCQHSN